MKSSVKNGRLTAALLVSAIGLAACGSDNDSDPAPAASAPPAGAPAPATAAASSVPASAGASVQAYLAYLRGLKTDETSSPVTVGTFTPPVDDSGAATPIGS
jgi:hypothetical protein